MVYDTLYGQDANYQSQPEMVEGHVVDADHKLWTLTLREGLRFHDGTPVLGRDVVASLQRWGQADPEGRAMMQELAEMGSPSDRVVTVRFREPYRLLPDVLGKIAPSMACIMPERLASQPANKPVSEIVGSGPFRFVTAERVPGSRAVFERFEGYQPRGGDGPPGLTTGPKRVLVDRVEWITMPDPVDGDGGDPGGRDRLVGGADAGCARVAAAGPEAHGGGAGQDGRGADPAVQLPAEAVRQPGDPKAVADAAVQSEFMQAFSSDPTLWRDKVGLFTPGTPMASDAGLDRKPISTEEARRRIEAAGYKGERVVRDAADRPSGEQHHGPGRRGAVQARRAERGYPGDGRGHDVPAPGQPRERGQGRLEHLPVDGRGRGHAEPGGVVPNAGERAGCMVRVAGDTEARGGAGGVDAGR